MKSRVKSSEIPTILPNMFWDSPDGLVNGDAFCVVVVVDDVSKKKMSPCPSRLDGALTTSEVPSFTNSRYLPNRAGANPVFTYVAESVMLIFCEFHSSLAES